MASLDQRVLDAIRSRPEVVDLFWARVDKSGECWVWKLGKNKRGYGVFNIPPVHGNSKGWKGIAVLAHRFAMLATCGGFPEAKPCALHHCDNPPCVRPDLVHHVFPGTRAENNHDMQRKGRCASGDANGSRIHIAERDRGEDHPHAKLTEAAVHIIRRSSEDPRVLAREFGVSAWTVRNVLNRKTWVHI